MKPGRRRIDLLLVERGLAESREKAQAMVMAGEVLADGMRVDKPGRSYPDDTRLQVATKPRYVSRGGIKLEAALREFEIDPAGKVCIDIGTSTGGFTDCLLQHGAARVHAVDTGAGQIDWRLRTDPRVIQHENTNARHLRPEEIGEPADLLVCDVSFISVTLLLDRLVALLKPEADIVILVKPQFEVGRQQVGKGGIVRDAASRAEACRKVQRAVEALGYHTKIISSPITGAEGNQEFLLHASHQSGRDRQ